MIRQQFDVGHYWKVTVWYSIDCSLFHIIAKELKEIGFAWNSIADVYWNMATGKAKAVTCSSLDRHESIVIFNPHTSKADYINSIVHEATHVMQAMLKTYQVRDEGEPPAYTVGFIVMKMYEVFRKFLLTYHK